MDDLADKADSFFVELVTLMDKHRVWSIVGDGSDVRIYFNTDEGFESYSLVEFMHVLDSLKQDLKPT